MGYPNPPPLSKNIVPSKDRHENAEVNFLSSKTSFEQKQYTI